MTDYLITVYAANHQNNMLNNFHKKDLQLTLTPTLKGANARRFPSVPINREGAGGNEQRKRREKSTESYRD